MNPAQLLSMLGISLADLTSAMRFDKALRVLGEQASNLGQFTTLLRQNPIAGLTLAARQAYNVANYLAFQPQYLAMLGAGVTIPYQMASFATRSGAETAAAANYRYIVAIDVYLPDQDIRQTYHVTISSETPRQSAELFQDAWDHLTGLPKFQKYSALYEEDRTYYKPTFEITSFFRLTGGR